MSESRRVLVVDDDPDLRSAVADALEDAGYRPLTAEHGRAALDLLQRSRDVPEVILLDVMMPVMDGFTFAAEMKKNPRWAAISLVLFTAHADHARVAEAVQAVASLRKPLKLNQLLAVVELAMRFSGTEAAASPGVHS
jgi:two-component system, chemotaxis family, chemotaxis protein CheY